jgi:hypothetical protein
MSTGIVAALVLTQRNGIKLEDLIEKFSWLKELIIAKGVNLLSKFTRVTANPSLSFVNA